MSQQNPGPRKSRPSSPSGPSLARRHWQILAALLALLAHLALHGARELRTPAPTQTFHDYDLMPLSYARELRTPAPTQTFHDYDLMPLSYALVQRGYYKAEAVPVARLVPRAWEGFDRTDLLRAAWRTPPHFENSYQTTGPLGWMLSALPATLLGIHPLTVRLGPFLPVALMVLLIFGIAHRAASKNAGLVAALMMIALPAAYQSARVAGPFAGNMLAVALVLWLILRSDFFRLPHWGLLVGLALGTAPRWGESVGDGMQVLIALSGPVAAAIPVALWQSVRQRQWWRPLVVVGAAGIAWAVADKAWLLGPGLHQVMDQAGMGGRRPFLHSAESALLRAAGNWDLYPRAIYLSLLAPLGAICCAAGALLGLSLSRDRWKVAWLLLSSLGILVAISASNKGNDYYALVAIPGLVAAAAIGLLSVPRIGPWMAGLVVVALTASAVGVTSLDRLPPKGAHCRPPLSTLWLADAEICTPVASQGELELFFQRWRRYEHRQAGRDRLAHFLTGDGGRAQLAALDRGALLLVLDTQMSEADVALFYLQLMRPDVLVRLQPPELPNQVDRAMMRPFTSIYAVQVGQFVNHDRPAIGTLPEWITSEEVTLSTQSLRIVKMSNRP